MMNASQHVPTTMYHQTMYSGHVAPHAPNPPPMGQFAAQLEEDKDARIPTQSHEAANTHSNGGTKGRKRRRGAIEKRRRDRINLCLNELRRLVPAAFEHQGQQKLEKAEILQLTVEHLRWLQTREIDTMFYDPHSLTYYQSLGYRECASEVSRFLNAQGLQPNDVLHSRLIQHLRSAGPHEGAFSSVLTTKPPYTEAAFSTPQQQQQSIPYLPATPVKTQQQQNYSVTPAKPSHTSPDTTDQWKHAEFN